MTRTTVVIKPYHTVHAPQHFNVLTITYLYQGLWYNWYNDLIILPPSWPFRTQELLTP